MSRCRSVFALSVALASWSVRANADDESLEGLLNESVVTAASDTAETQKDAPATSTVVTADAIRKYGARTLAEAIDMLALGAMSGNNGTTTDMGARGVTVATSGAEHFLLLINGARANTFLNGLAPMGRDSGIPLDIVDHIEVILGPGSVLYGSNAMLGVINVVTKAAKDFDGPRIGVESELLTSIRPWAGYGERFELGGVQGEVTTEVQYFKQWGPNLYVAPAYGGTDPGTGRPYRYTLLGTSATGTGVWGGADASTLSTWDAPSAIGVVRFGKFELGYNGSITRNPLNTTANDFDSDAHSVNRRLLLNLAYSNTLTPVVSIRAHAYLNSSDENSTFYASWSPDCPNANIDCHYDVRLEGIVRGVEVTPSLDWLQNGTFVTLVGADGEWRTGRSLVNDYDAATQAPVSPSYGSFTHEDLAFGAYAQQTWDPTRWFGLNAGSRLDYDPRFAPELSPRLAARVDPWPGGTLKVVYSHAFRAPSFYESYFSHPLNPPPDNLQPEHEQSFEASVEQRFSTHRILFVAFLSHWTNLIEEYRFTAAEAAQYVAEGKSILPPQYQERNIASIRNYGFNAAFDGSQLSGVLQYGVNLTAALALEGDSGADSPLPVSPRAFGNAHVSYQLPGLLPTLALAATAESERPFEAAFTSAYGRIPYSPPKLVLHATVSGPLPIVKGLSYRVTGFYSTTDREPYRIGPDLEPSPQTPSPSLVPIDRARAMVGLEYEFGK